MSVACRTGAHIHIRIDGLPLAASRTKRRSECNVRSVSPGPDRAPSGCVRNMMLRNPRSLRPSTSVGVSITTPISSWSSPPGKPVPWAVEPTSTSRIVDGGSGGMSNTARSSPTSPPPMAPIRPAAGRSREATALAAASAGPAASMACLVGLLPSGCPAREGRDWAAPRTCPQAPPASASAAGRGLVGQRLRRGG